MRVRKERSGGRRALAGVAAAAGLAALRRVVLLATSAGGSNGGYTVRAIFDDANNIIPGENVDIAAVKVGTVKSVEPTPHGQGRRRAQHRQPRLPGLPQRRHLHDPPAGPDRREVRRLPADRTARPEGTPLAPPLKKIPSGHEGAGQYHLPVTNTHSPVGHDLLNDIQHLPERQRFTIIINELGAGLLDRGSDLSAVIRRANPALQELDKVLSILAGENKVLEELAVNSDKALKPFAASASTSPNSSPKAKDRRGGRQHAGGWPQPGTVPDLPELLVPAVERLGRSPKRPRRRCSTSAQPRPA